MGSGIFCTLLLDREVSTTCSAHNHRRTNASASLKVGCVFLYHALRRTGRPWCLLRPWAITLTSENSENSENSANNNGVVRAIALSDHCCWVFHTQMGTHFGERDLHLPARDKPLHDLLGARLRVGTQQRLGGQRLSGITNQHPMDRYSRFAAMRPYRRARGDRQATIGLTVPACHCSGLMGLDTSK